MGNGFTINAHRFDPYKNFKFRVLWTIGGTVKPPKTGPPFKL
jgi:hypothetical protein